MGPDTGKRTVVVITKKEHAAMHEKAKLDIEKIAQAAGVEMTKTARIIVKRGKRQAQEKGLRELNKLLQEMGSAEKQKDVVAQAGIAVGYANAMENVGLMTESELKDVIDVIGQAGERASRRIKTADRSFRSRIIKKFHGKGGKRTWQKEVIPGRVASVGKASL